MAVKQPARGPAPRPAASPPPARPGPVWSRLHFVVRFLGLTGFLVACVGLVLAGLSGLLATWDAARDAIRRAVSGGPTELGTWLVLVGLVAVVIALLVEALVSLRTAAGRRGAFGFNAVVQVALATALLVGLNAWSFRNYLRFDWTRDSQFTLPTAIRDQLARLDPSVPTTIVVYQQHKTFGALTDKPDRFDYAAERKVVEKVKDLVEQFRELGGRFTVEVLDVEEEGYDDRLEKVTRNAPELKKAIDRAPENSVFVYAGGKVQQMSFNEFYLLDRAKSQEANEGRGNLVLLAQGRGTKDHPASGRGVEPFADKVLNVEERRPRIGVLVMHELLTTEGSEDAFTLAGLRKALETNGFEVRDVVLRRVGDTGPEPAADTFEESKLDRLDADLEDAKAELGALEAELKIGEEQAADFDLKPGDKEEDKLEAISKKYSRALRGGKLTSEGRKVLLAQIRGGVARLRELFEAAKKERDRVQAERAALNIDQLQEARRMRDIKAKLDRALADCDLLFIPRLTRRANGGFAAPYRFHRMSEAQLASVREFLEAGKPIFVCAGPVNDPPDFNLGPDAEGPDGLDRLLGDLGVRLGKQTVLFTTDAKAFADRRVNPFRTDDAVRVPPLDFEAAPSAWQGKWAALKEGTVPPNPIRDGLRIIARSARKRANAKGPEATEQDKRRAEVAIRFPRPVWYEAPAGVSTRFEPTFLVTAEGWNEDKPYATRGRKPHFEPPKKDDPDNGTAEEKRRGAFSVGVAVEAPLPSSWSSGTQKSVRLAVIGQGDVFVGDELSPGRERLFLETANWLLGRDDYLPVDDHPWSYPRVALAPGSQEEQLWLWGARLGLPVLFAYLGLVVLLVRRLR